MSVPPPSVPGGYQLQRPLGRGAYGEVWLAEAPGGVEVAVKTIYRSLKPEEAGRELEALQLIKRLRHQNLLSLQAFFALEDRLVIVLELADRSLRQCMADCRAAGQPGIPAAELLSYFQEVAEALDHLHQNKVVHRDVKPDNILLMGRHAKLADYGLARLLEKQSLQSGTTIGTPLYTAPEAWKGKVSRHTDQYSLAVTYAELGSGRLPLLGDNLFALMAAHVQSEPDLAAFAAKEQAVLWKALTKEPGQRFPSCAAFVQSLREARADGVDGKRPPDPPTRGPTTRIPNREVSQPIRIARPSPLDCTGAVGLTAAEVREAQEAWARYLGRQVEETVEIADGVQMTFVLVPPGKFRMGSPESEKERSNDETLHVVTLTEPFDMAKTPLTQAQYEVLTGHSPSHFKGADNPVEQVSWEDAHDYAAKLTKKKSDKHLYRLPTEAEWEYACRGGRPSSKPFGVGDGHALSSRQANFNGNSPYGIAAEGPYLQSTCRVGSYPANALGLLDMHGNIWEWCADWWGMSPILRGGSWYYPARHCRAAIRVRYEPERRHDDLGFRLARSVPSGGK